VTNRQTVHGFVGIGLGGAGDWYIKVTDPDSVENVEAGGTSTNDTPPRWWSAR
jgi:hypothetical protein